MIPPLLSSQIDHLERMVWHFGKNWAFLSIFSDYSYFWLKNGIFRHISASKFATGSVIMLPPLLLLSQIHQVERLVDILAKVDIFGNIFLLFLLWATTGYFRNISGYKFGTILSIMLPPLLSSQIGQFESLVLHFGELDIFGNIMATFGIFQVINVDLPIWSCYFLFCHLNLAILKEWSN